MREISVGMNEAGQRMDKLLRKILRNAGDAFLYKMLRKKNILLNGHKATGKERLQEGDAVRIYLSEETFARMSGEGAGENVPMLPPAAMPGGRADGGEGNAASGQGKEGGWEGQGLAGRILYEDAHILLLNKPAGWLSQGDGSGMLSANERCIEYLLQKGELSPRQLATFRPGVANRLDRNTSGILIFGKTLPALQALSELLRGHKMEKEYLAVVGGFVQEGGRIRGYLRKDAGRNRARVAENPFPGAVRIDTAYTPLYRAALRPLDVSDKKAAVLPLPSDDPSTAPYAYTLLKVQIYTGKPHQIRAQLAALGHPILGDPKYGNAAKNRAWERAAGVKFQLLHAFRLAFPAPLQGVLAPLSGKAFYAEAPAYFQPFLPVSPQYPCMP